MKRLARAAAALLALTGWGSAHGVTPVELRPYAILSRFRSFYFWEGVANMLAGHALEKRASRRLRFLLIQGDQPSDSEPDDRMERRHLLKALTAVAEARRLHFTSITMRGYGHEFPSER